MFWILQFRYCFILTYVWLIMNRDLELWMLTILWIIILGRKFISRIHFQLRHCYRWRHWKVFFTVMNQLNYLQFLYLCVYAYLREHLVLFVTFGSLNAYTLIWCLYCMCVYICLFIWEFDRRSHILLLKSLNRSLSYIEFWLNWNRLQWITVVWCLSYIQTYT
jgi:hypothetical protein